MAYTINLTCSATVTKTQLGTPVINDYDGVYYYTYTSTVLAFLDPPLNEIKDILSINGESLLASFWSPITINTTDANESFTLPVNGSLPETFIIKYQSNSYPDIDFYLTDADGNNIDFNTYLKLTNLSADNIEIQTLYSKKAYSGYVSDVRTADDSDWVPAYDIENGVQVLGLPLTTENGGTATWNSLNTSANHYPWMGFIKINNYKYDNVSKAFLLPGTRPLINSIYGIDYGFDQNKIPTHVDLHEELPGSTTWEYYLITRTPTDLKIYPVLTVTVSSDLTTYELSYMGTPTVFTVEDFCEKVIPLRIFISATGGGGGGGGSGWNDRGSGGGAGGTAFGIVDLIKYPALLIGIGKRGAGGSAGTLFGASGNGTDGEKTSVIGLTTIPSINNGKASISATNGNMVLLLAGYGGKAGIAGATNSRSSGGSYDNELPYRIHSNNNTSTASGADGGKGGCADNATNGNGTGITANTFQQYVLSSNKSLSSSYPKYTYSNNNYIQTSEYINVRSLISLTRNGCSGGKGGKKNGANIGGGGGGSLISTGADGSGNSGTRGSGGGGGDGSKAGGNGGTGAVFLFY